MTINGHLLLLVVATGVFVRVWSANGQTQLTTVMRNPSPAVAVGLPRVTPFTTETVVVHQTVSVSTTTVAAEENWTPANCPIPLPAGISIGIYRVVDDTGRVARLEIAAADVAIADNKLREIPTDFNIVSIGAQRWYFIRLQSPVAVENRNGSENGIGDATTGDEDIACPFRNRKFDFTGYETSNAVDEPVAGEFVTEAISRPDPPELPL